MTVIAPAILTDNADQYKSYMETLSTFAKRVHVDITDGEFAPSFTIAEKDAWWPAELEADVHAMVARPSEHVQAMVALKPNMIVFHVEVQEDLLPVIDYVKKAGIKAGVALQRPTVPASVQAYIEQADHVLIFSGDLGHYGGTASMMQLEKVRLVRNIKPMVEVGWDGGVNMENAFSLSQGGVDVLNVGGTIAKSDDPAGTYNALVGEINKQGVI